VCELGNGLQWMKTPPKVTLPGSRNVGVLMVLGKSGRLTTSLSTWVNIEGVDDYVTRCCIIFR
jgi:hypothetical protein